MPFILSIEKSPVDTRDYVYETSLTVDTFLPETFDCRPSMLNVRDQGPNGTCAAFTASSIKEYQERKQIDFQEYMSPQFVYNNRENKTTEGMYSRDLMKILNKIGIVPETMYPYGSKSKMTAELLHQASNYRICGYAMALTVDGLKSAIYKNGPALLAVPVYNYGPRLWKPSAGQKLLGGHAMTMVGWTTNGFIVRNSWGNNWGNNGYTIFPYADWGLQWEIWTTIDASSIKNFPPLPKKPVVPPRRYTPSKRYIPKKVLKPVKPRVFRLKPFSPN